MERETWMPLKGFEDCYVINDEGVVKSLPRCYINTDKHLTVKGTIITPRVDKRTGYPVVKICRQGKCGTKFLHRLLAETFIPNPENKCCVNHKNGIKTDLSLDNLEWATYSENQKHAIKTALSKLPTPLMKKVVDTCNGVEYESIQAASIKLGVNYKTLQKKLNGGGFGCFKMAA